MSIDKYLINHCAPTLASIKTANLFSVSEDAGVNVKEEVEFINRRYKEKGIEAVILNRKNGRALVYVYRRSRLMNDLSCDKARRILKEHGYSGCDSLSDVEYAIRQLAERIGRCEGFPHEIGLFLGYPPEDVEGFILNEGKNCLCAGCWKVYGDRCSAEKCFRRFSLCSRIYRELWESGRDIEKMVVAA